MISLRGLVCTNHALPLIFSGFQYNYRYIGLKGDPESLERLRIGQRRQT